MKRFFLLTALIGGALLASAPGAAMAHGWRWWARRGYYGPAYQTYVVPAHPHRTGVVVQTPATTTVVTPAPGTVYQAR